MGQLRGWVSGGEEVSERRRREVVHVVPWKVKPKSLKPLFGLCWIGGLEQWGPLGERRGTGTDQPGRGFGDELWERLVGF